MSDDKPVQRYRISYPEDIIEDDDGLWVKAEDHHAMIGSQLEKTATAALLAHVRYRLLLKYIKHVRDCEGVDYLIDPMAYELRDG